MSSTGATAAGFAPKRHRGQSVSNDWHFWRHRTDTIWSHNATRGVVGDDDDDDQNEEEEETHHQMHHDAEDERRSLHRHHHPGVDECLSHSKKNDDNRRLSVKDLHVLNMFNRHSKHESTKLARDKRHHQREEQEHYDSLDDMEFDNRPRLGYRYPLLQHLHPKALKEFKIDLEAAEDMRTELNRVREAHRQIPPPEPRVLVSRKLWGYVTVEMRKINPELHHFLDATYADLIVWLTRALVPAPNNRPFFKRLEQDLKKAWAESYFFGAPRTLLCMPLGGHGRGPHDEEEDDQVWDLQEDVKKSKNVDPKKLSTTSSVTTFSFGNAEESEM